MSEKYLKASEVAKKLGVKHVTVRSWLNKKIFPNAKLEETILGKVWLIPESDLVGFSLPKVGRPSKNVNKAK
jgi:Helix-turn-helix domain